MEVLKHIRPYFVGIWSTTPSPRGRSGANLRSNAPGRVVRDQLAHIQMRQLGRSPPWPTRVDGRPASMGWIYFSSRVLTLGGPVWYDQRERDGYIYIYVYIYMDGDRNIISCFTYQMYIKWFNVLTRQYRYLYEYLRGSWRTMHHGDLRIPTPA